MAQRMDSVGNGRRRDKQQLPTNRGQQLRPGFFGVRKGAAQRAGLETVKLPLPLLPLLPVMAVVLRRGGCSRS